VNFVVKIMDLCQLLFLQYQFRIFFVLFTVIILWTLKN